MHRGKFHFRLTLHKVQVISKSLQVSASAGHPLLCGCAAAATTAWEFGGEKKKKTLEVLEHAKKIGRTTTTTKILSWQRANQCRKQARRNHWSMPRFIFKSLKPKKRVVYCQIDDNNNRKFKCDDLFRISYSRICCCCLRAIHFYTCSQHSLLLLELMNEFAVNVLTRKI